MRMNAGYSRMGTKELSAEIPSTLNPLEVYIALTVRMRGISVPMSLLFISVPVQNLILQLYVTRQRILLILTTSTIRIT